MDGSGWLSDISIHAPRMGSDPSSFSGFEAISLFQSTLLAWGATFRSAGGSDTLEFQSTLPAWGATRLWLWGMHNANISIHAPRMGSDFDMQRENPTGYANFNPRFPHGERPSRRSDNGQMFVDFNPRSPHGERPPLTKSLTTP